MVTIALADLLMVILTAGLLFVGFTSMIFQVVKHLKK